MPPLTRVLVAYFDAPEEMKLYLINMDPDQLALARRCNGHMVNGVGTDGDAVLARLALKALLQGKKPLQVTPGAAIPNSMCDEVISTGWIS